jgi:hypothetical protein
VAGGFLRHESPGAPTDWMARPLADRFAPNQVAPIRSLQATVVPSHLIVNDAS